MEQRIDNIQQIIQLSKCIKSDIIMTNGNFMYGSDFGFNYLKILEFDNINNININFVYKDFSKICKDESFIIIKSSLICNDIMRLSSECKTEKGTCEINSLRISFHMDNLIKNTMNILQQHPVTHVNENFKDNEQFSKSLNMKTENGICLVREVTNDGRFYILSLFKNLVALNKADSIKLEIIDLEDVFLAHYIIHKKKEKVTIHEYVQYLKMY